MLAFRWVDFDPEKKTIRVERAIGDQEVRHPLQAAEDVAWEGSVSLLLQLRETHLRLCAGVPDGVEVDLSLIRLPDDALIFPNPPGPGEDFSFTQPRDPHTFSKQSGSARLDSASPTSNSTICAELMRRCYWTAGCPCIPSPSGSGMTRRCC